MTDALWVADMTTGPTGERMTYAQRLREITDRYDSDAPPYRAMINARPVIEEAFRRTAARLDQRQIPTDAPVRELREFVGRLQRDVAGVDPAAVIGIYDLEVERWVVEPPPDRMEPPEDFGSDGLVGRIYGSDFLLLVEAASAEGLAFIADRVQDDVIDELGRSWPDVEHGGRVVHLEPVVHRGMVVWGYRGEPVRAIGELA